MEMFHPKFDIRYDYEVSQRAPESIHSLFETTTKSNNFFTSSSTPSNQNESHQSNHIHQDKDKIFENFEENWLKHYSTSKDRGRVNYFGPKSEETKGVFAPFTDGETCWGPPKNIFTEYLHSKDDSDDETDHVASSDDEDTMSRELNTKDTFKYLRSLIVKTSKIKRILRVQSKFELLCLKHGVNEDVINVFRRAKYDYKLIKEFTLQKWSLKSSSKRDKAKINFDEISKLLEEKEREEKRIRSLSPNQIFNDKDLVIDWDYVSVEAYKNYNISISPEALKHAWSHTKGFNPNFKPIVWNENELTKLLLTVSDSTDFCEVARKMGNEAGVGTYFNIFKNVILPNPAFSKARASLGIRDIEKEETKDSLNTEEQKFLLETLRKFEFRDLFRYKKLARKLSALLEHKFGNKYTETVIHAFIREYKDKISDDFTMIRKGVYVPKYLTKSKYLNKLKFSMDSLSLQKKDENEPCCSSSLKNENFEKGQRSREDFLNFEPDEAHNCAFDAPEIVVENFSESDDSDSIDYELEIEPMPKIDAKKINQEKNIEESKESNCIDTNNLDVEPNLIRIKNLNDLMEKKEVVRRKKKTYHLHEDKLKFKKLKLKKIIKRKVVNHKNKEVASQLKLNPNSPDTEKKNEKNESLEILGLNPVKVLKSKTPEKVKVSNKPTFTKPKGVVKDIFEQLPEAQKIELPEPGSNKKVSGKKKSKLALLRSRVAARRWIMENAVKAAANKRQENEDIVLEN